MRYHNLENIPPLNTNTSEQYHAKQYLIFISSRPKTKKQNKYSHQHDFIGQHDEKHQELHLSTLQFKKIVKCTCAERNQVDRVIVTQQTELQSKLRNLNCKTLNERSKTKTKSI